MAIGGWRSANDVRGSRIEDDLLEEVENEIRADQRIDGDPGVVAVLAPTYVVMGYSKLRFPIALMLTTTRVVFGCPKGIRRKIDVTNLSRFDIAQFSQPMAEQERFYLRMDHDRIGIIRAYFRTMEEPEVLAEYLANG